MTTLRVDNPISLKGAVTSDGQLLDQWGNDPNATAGLTWGYRAGLAIDATGAQVRLAAGTVLLADNATNYVERSYDGTIAVNQTGFTKTKVALAKVTTAGGAITAIEDWRPVHGPFPYYPVQDGEAGVTDLRYPAGDVRRYGALPDGATNASAAFTAAATWAGATQVISVGAGALPYHLTANLTLTAPVSFALGAIVQPANGVTLTLNGPVSAPLAKIFDTSLGGTVVFGAGTADVFRPEWWGAKGDGATDDTVPYQAALDAVDPTRGGEVLMAARVYRTRAELLVKKRTRIRGQGWLSSLIHADHDGNGLRCASGLNATTEASVVYSHFGIYCTRNTNAGGGIVDEGSSYITLDHVYVESFQDNVIFDQTEHGTIWKCYLNRLTSQCRSGVWLVNGADRRVGASKRYTNRISVRDTQFSGVSGVGIAIRDDGGVNHSFGDNNINIGLTGIYAADVSGLVITGNESEGNTNAAIVLDNLSSIGGANVGGCDGIQIAGNTFSDASPYHIQLNDGRSGQITANVHASYTTAAIKMGSDTAVQFRIGQNSKCVTIASGRPTGPFVDATVTRLLAQRYEQDIQTHVALALVAGANVVVTPQTMGPGITSALEQIVPGKRLVCANADWSNLEVVTVKATTGTTFAADFASNKTAGWIVVGAPFPNTNGFSPDRQDNDVTAVPGFDCPNQRFLTAFSADHTITFSTNGAQRGTVFNVTWGALGAHNLTLKDGGGTVLKTVSVAAAGWATVAYDENIGVYRLTGYGSL